MPRRWVSSYGVDWTLRVTATPPIFWIREIGDDELGAVGEHQGHLVPFPDAEGAQMVSQGAGRPVQFPVGNPSLAVDDGNVFRKVLGAFRQHLSQAHDVFPTPESASEPFPAACCG